MSSLAQNIKQKIMVQLQTLQTAGIICSIIEVDQSPDPLQIEPDKGYPMAIVGMPAMISDYEDQASNKRIYEVKLLVAHQLGQTTGGEDIEILFDNIVNQFDKNGTLNTSETFVLPAEVIVAPVTNADKTFAVFLVRLRVETLFEIG